MSLNIEKPRFLKETETYLTITKKKKKHLIDVNLNRYVFTST